MLRSTSFRNALLAGATALSHLADAASRAALEPAAERVPRIERLAAGELVEAGQRGDRNRRILLERRVGAYAASYHATKGWRRRRIAA